MAGVEQDAAAAGARAGAAFAAGANATARIVPTINTSAVNAAVNRVSFRNLLASIRRVLTLLTVVGVAVALLRTRVGQVVLRGLISSISSAIPLMGRLLSAATGLSGSLRNMTPGDLFRGLVRGVGTFNSLRRAAMGVGAAVGGIAAVSLAALKLGPAIAGAGVAALGAQAAIGGLVTVVGGLAIGIGQMVAGGLAALPAVLGAVGLAVATLKVGFSGFGDALSAADPAAFEEALQKLAPSAQEAARAIRAMGPAWESLKLDVQQRLFSGLGPIITQLGGSYLPILQSAMGGVADSFNAAFVEVGKFLAAPSIVKDFAGSFANLQTGIGNATGALLPLTMAFTDLFAVGSTFMPRLGTAIADLATRFAGFISGARESGQISVWIENGITAAKQFGAILGNIGGVLSAANSVGGGLMNTLVSITGELDAVVNSVAGQTALTSFFQGAADATKALLPAMGSLMTVLGVLGPALTGVGQAIAPALVPIIDGIAAGIANATPGLTRFAEGLAAWYTAFTPLLPLIGQVAGAIMNGIGNALTFVAPLLTAVTSVLAFFGPAIAPIAGLIATLVVTFNTLSFILGPIIGVVRQLIAVWNLLKIAFIASPIGLVVTLIAGLVAGLIYAYNTSETFRNIVNGAFAAVGAFIGLVIEQAKLVIGSIVTTLTTVATAIGAWVAGVVTWFTDLGTQIVTTVSTFVTGVITWWTTLFTTVTGAIGGFVAGVVAWFVGLGTQIITTLTNLFNFVMATPFGANLQAIVTAVSGFVTGVVGWFVNLGQQITSAVTGFVSAVIGFFANLVATVSAAVSGFVSATVAFFQNLISTVSGAVSGFVATIVGFFRNQLIAPVSSAVSGFVGQVIGFFQNLVGSVSGAISGMVGNVVGAIRGMISTALGVLNSWVGQMAGIGRNIINGIVNGLRSAAGAVQNFLMDMARRALNAVLSFLGIASPSKVFAGVGKNIGLGLVNGIRGITGAVVEQAREMARAASDAAAVAATPPVTTVTGAGRAAQELLNQARGGGAIFEDFSFRGNSNLVSQFNDTIADAFYKANPRFDMGRADAGAVVSKFLESYIRSQTTTTRPTLPASSMSSIAGAAAAAVQTSPAHTCPTAEENGAALVEAMRRAGFEAGDIVTTVTNINPIAETGTDSTNRELRRFAAVGGFRR